MRSRYVAYCLNEEQYLLQSWHISTRPASVKAEAGIQWIRLKIVDAVSRDDQVEFIATFRLNGKAHKLKEKSRFLFDGEDWFYLDAIIK